MASSDPESQLILILDNVRSALREGDYAALEPLAVQQDRMFDRLKHTKTPKSGQYRRKIAKIRAEAAHNQRLLTAARNGLKSAQRRSLDVISAFDRTELYDRSGQKIPLDRSIANLEKRS